MLQKLFKVWMQYSARQKKNNKARLKFTKRQHQMKLAVITEMRRKVAQNIMVRSLKKRFGQRSMEICMKLWNNKLVRNIHFRVFWANN